MPGRYTATDPDDWDDDDEDEGEEEDPDDDGTDPCPHCGRDVHHESIRCPHCGEYQSREDAPREPKSWWILLGVAVCLYVIYSWYFGF